MIDRTIPRAKASEAKRSTTERSARVKASEAKRNAKVLEDYFVVNDEYHALERERKRLRGEVDMIPAGKYGDWEKAYGTPGKTTDMDAVARRYEELGEVVPTREKAAPLQVKRLA